MSAGPVEIRPFATIEEYRACVALQEQVWGGGFSERVPMAILKVAQRLGGLAAGAWNQQGELIGFVFGMTGVEQGRLVHWSDMLAVLPGLRDAGLGQHLKAFQRERMLALGVERMYWTFDPLQSRNAYLNFNKLGIVVREYARDMYGQTDSPLHAGIGTDRFVALWLLRTERVERRLAGDRPTLTGEGLPSALDLVSGGEVPEPGVPALRLDDAAVLVSIPGNIDELKRLSLPAAVRWREATRAVFTHYLDREYEVRELLRFGEESRYLVARIDSPE